MVEGLNFFSVCFKGLYSTFVSIKKKQTKLKKLVKKKIIYSLSVSSSLMPTRNPKKKKEKRIKIKNTTKLNQERQSKTYKNALSPKVFWRRHQILHSLNA